MCVDISWVGDELFWLIKEKEMWFARGDVWKEEFWVVEVIGFSEERIEKIEF